MLDIHRTHRAKIRNHSQVAEMLDQHGWSASKLWNVANYHSRSVWEETGEIPDHGDLKNELKSHPKYRGLHSQSSQKVLEELSEAFNSWYGKRKSDDRANPPGFFSRALAPVRMVRETSGLTLTARKTTTTTMATASTKNTPGQP